MKALGRSLLIAVLPAILQCVSTSLIGYGLARFRVPGKGVILALVLATFIIPPQATMIPQMLMYTNVGMDNILAFLVPALFGQGLKSAIFILIFFQFIDQIPDALIEAARIDGASELRIVWKIIFPLLKPPIATVALLSFQSAWGNVEASNLFIDDETLKSFAYFMTTFQSSNMGIAGTGISAASALIMFVPNLIIFIVLQSKVMDTMSTSGIK